MKIKPECATCIIRQIVDISIEVTDDEIEQFRLVKGCMPVINEEYHNNAVPAWMGTVIHRHFKKISNCEDPYKRLKETANDTAQNYIEDVENKIKNSDNELDRLKKCVLATIAGNSIDFGPFSISEDIVPMIEHTLNSELKIDCSKELLEDLKSAKKVLYICDNAGEIVFDILLIKMIKKYVNDINDIVVAVKGKPILNDATMEDAENLKINEFAKVITTGSDIIGIILEECSEEFLKEFEQADLIIAKGMGNFESLTEYNLNHKKLYYILKAKCDPVAEFIGVDLKDSVLLSNKQLQKNLANIDKN
ncbi:damage-control phosphatase ARMT1 family protein [Methanococcus aeolicus]|uniref:Damage-control phosphatase ARMT1-like metal-binding domain-containing protein n=1 Tax=Methanococcus aeolicus (strain ATCC BAA-1280 / DSM 17508 / OCM 812 / Nankai-3) TaxID=419665 RepID=A6UV72_META3|nr:DUF89 domain-containing protein [Methanococcus aeolicus]ABR56394.1 protein of unknown function DUF89 [Methanococcus aeolicus Nankai-3]UXM84392.1 DUF89 domain-containing protein [Methanococcus aeolicus]